MCTLTDIGTGIFLIIASCFDIRKRGLPMWFLIGMNLFSVALCIRNSVISTVGGILIGAIFLLISKTTRESIGYGDSWMILILGIYLGFQKILAVIFLASLLAGLFSLFFYCRYRKKKITLPFIPFLMVAYGLAVVL